MRGVFGGIPREILSGKSVLFVMKYLDDFQYEFIRQIMEAPMEKYVQDTVFFFVELPRVIIRGIV